MPVSTAQLNGGHKVARDGSVGVGEEGADLRTLYEIWQAETEGGTFQDFLAALREPQEPVESLIVNPSTGEPYDLPPAQVTDEQGAIPVRAALEGITSGVDDLDGRSLYAQAQAAGYGGTEAEFYAALVAQPSGGGGEEWEADAWTDPVTYQAVVGDLPLKRSWIIPYPREAIFQPHLEMSFRSEWVNREDDSTRGEVRFPNNESPRIEFELDEGATSEETHWLFPLAISGATRLRDDYLLRGELRLLDPYHEVQDLRFCLRYKT